jgi:hypothetical protein
MGQGRNRCKRVESADPAGATQVSTARRCDVSVARRRSDFSGGVAPYALDAENAVRLWGVALELLSLI